MKYMIKYEHKQYTIHVAEKNAVAAEKGGGD
jgi:hypothetical protein